MTYLPRVRGGQGSAMHRSLRPLFCKQRWITRKRGLRLVVTANIGRIVYLASTSLSPLGSPDSLLGSLYLLSLWGRQEEPGRGWPSSGERTGTG